MYFMDYFVQGVVISCKIVVINVFYFNFFEVGSVFGGILCLGFCCVSRDVLVVVLYQINNGKLFKCGYLQGFSYFFFCYRSIVQGINYDGVFFIKIFCQFLLFFVLNVYGYVGGWNSLYFGC